MTRLEKLLTFSAKNGNYLITTGGKLRIKNESNQFARETSYGESILKCMCGRDPLVK